MNFQNLIILVVLFFIASPLFAQKEIGKIISPEEAQKLFGSVTIEKEIPLDAVKEAVDQSSNHVYFNIINDHLFVSSDGKNLTYPKTNYSQAPNIFFIFTKGIVSEFIGTNPQAEKIKVQMRGNILCLFNGKQIMEFSLQCPPYCFEK